MICAVRWSLVHSQCCAVRVCEVQAAAATASAATATADMIFHCFARFCCCGCCCRCCAAEQFYYLLCAKRRMLRMHKQRDEFVEIRLFMRVIFFVVRSLGASMLCTKTDIYVCVELMRLIEYLQL